MDATEDTSNQWPLLGTSDQWPLLGTSDQWPLLQYYLLVIPHDIIASYTAVQEPMVEANDIAVQQLSHLFLQFFLYLLRTCRLDGVNLLLEVALL